jgi:hypothetical protein
VDGTLSRVSLSFKCKLESGEGNSAPDPEDVIKNLNSEVMMLWIILAVLVVLWLLGLVGGVGGSLIHALLAIAVVVLLYNLFSGRRTVS